VAASDREAAVPAVAAAVAELYGADPDVFTERRKALAAAAKKAGDREAAAAIGALRKPTRAAWVVNQLARAEPSAAGRMAALAAELRAAEQAGDGPRLRELSASRGALLDALTAQALAAAGTPDPPPSLRAEVTDTLTAALADPATAADFAAGRLTKAAQWGGFGYAGFTVADGSAVDTPVPGRPGTDGTGPSRPAERDRTPPNGPIAVSGPRSPARRRSAPGRTSGTPAPIPLPRQADRAKQAEPSGRAKLADTPATSLAGKRQAREQRERELREQREQQRRAEEEQQRAQEAAERAALAREKFEDAERSLAQTSATAAEAVAAEDRLEAEVRQLEERITQAREELATARLRARRAEAAERRARQARDRLL
jgi:hypothetical protein